jgi:RNA polymerase sigma-70 factor (ECF subfamily)
LGPLGASVFAGRSVTSAVVFLPFFQRERTAEAMESESFESEQLFKRYTSGDSEAADAIFDRYVRRLVGLAGQRLAPALRRRVDPEDVVQSAMRSFFVHARAGDYVLARSGDLWRLLAAITLHKLRDQVDRNRAGRRDYRRERDCESGDERLARGAEPVARRPTPDEEFAAVEQLQAIVQELPESVRSALTLRLAGNRIEDIAAVMQRSERTVRRLLETARRELARSISFRGANV